MEASCPGVDLYFLYIDEYLRIYCGAPETTVWGIYIEFVPMLPYSEFPFTFSLYIVNPET